MKTSLSSGIAAVMLLSATGCVSPQDSERQAAEAQEEARQRAAQQEAEIRSLLKDYKVMGTSYRQFRKDKDAGAWKVFALGIRSEERPASPTIVINETIGTEVRPICDLVFEGIKKGNNFDHCVLTSISFRP